jgi:5-methyltetrahydrofolate--homocysteine methyltransferase
MTDYDDDDYEDDLDLSTLPDDELVEQMHDDLYNGLKEEVAEGTEILLERGWDRDGILFVPEVLMSANAMKAGMAILKPLLSQSDEPTAGKMVIGTVKGDIHDIGKNLVCMMMEGAGFEVVDLGINTPVEDYLAALEEHKPEILGMSALLTTTMPYMKVVIDTMKEQGIRDDYIILVGGAPLNQEFGCRRHRQAAGRRKASGLGPNSGRATRVSTRDGKINPSSGNNLRRDCARSQ